MWVPHWPPLYFTKVGTWTYGNYPRPCGVIQKLRRNSKDLQGCVDAPVTSHVETHWRVTYPHGHVDAFSLKMCIIFHISLHASSSSNISTPKGRTFSPPQPFPLLFKGFVGYFWVVIQGFDFIFCSKLFPIPLPCHCFFPFVDWIYLAWFCMVYLLIML